MADIEVFLDQTPGETRGVIARKGRYHHLIIQRDSDRPSDRLGARSVGRIARVEPALRGAFVDLGAGEPYGFLPLGQNDKPGEGTKVEVEVSAEPRERKGPVLQTWGLFLSAHADWPVISTGTPHVTASQTNISAPRWRSRRQVPEKEKGPGHVAQASVRGQGEIRTRGGLPLNGFQDRLFRPLRHLS